MTGQNVPAREALQAFVERVELLKVAAKDVREDLKLVMAEVSAAGFVPKAISHIVKLRAMKPSDRQEAEGIIDLYLHAMGMVSETPIHRAVGMIGVDIASRESVIEALKNFVPEHGSIVVEAGGKPVRLTRGDDGEVTVTEVVERTPTEKPSAAIPRMSHPEPPPLCDEAGAEALGGGAFKENKPIIANPFPFGDVRRPRWDEGWRKASGTDGMGPGGA